MRTPLLRAIRARAFLMLISVIFLSVQPRLTLAETGADAFNTALRDLASAELEDVSTVLDRLTGTKDDRVLPALQALLDGKLYIVKASGQAVTAETIAGELRIADLRTGQVLSTADKSDLKKISTNNALRSRLRELLGFLQLSAPDRATRLQAVKALSTAATADGMELLRQRYADETDVEVRAAIASTLAFSDLGSADRSVRLAAIKTLADRQTQEVRGRLRSLLEKTPEGTYAEPDAEVRKAAERLVSLIDKRLQLFGLIETICFGISLGSVLVLSSIGLAITFGVMGVINMAHGELMMIGAYTTYTVQQLLPQYIDQSLFIAIPAAFVVTALVGIMIERCIIHYLYGRPLETLLATFGVSLILQQAVRSIYSPLNRSVSAPSWMSGSWAVNDVLSLTHGRIYIVVFSLLVFVGLVQILKRTRLGLEVRAVAQNRTMARAMGIPVRRVDMLTFGLGSGIAGVAGVALSQLTNVGPNLGQSYIVDSFMVVVFGGVGNLWGTLVGGLALGIVNKVLEPNAGAVLAKILVLIFIILFIQKRPRGLFPQKGRAAET
jgi:urea transport system permease protein